MASRPNNVIYELPQPPQPRIAYDENGSTVDVGPPHESGVIVVVTKEADGRSYVTDLQFYASS